MRRALISLACIFISTTANAKVLYDNDGRASQASASYAHRASFQNHHTQGRQSRRAHRVRHSRVAVSSQVSIVGGRPPGCPRQFCGCAASIKLFGQIRPRLNLASNWLRTFPRTTPGPMMAAARAGHVMVLLEHVSGDQWKVYDGNSGGGLTRIHVRSIRGFAVVNPRAGGA